MGRSHYQIDLLNPGHESCAHKHYLMSCGQYEHLLNRANGRCEMCGIPGMATPHRKLHIDHDIRHGIWAVRGLLCQPCNTHMHHPSRSFNRVRFLANPWFVEMLAANNAPLRIAEPPIGSTVYDAKRRRWRRGPKAWTRARDSWRGRYSADWDYLHRNYGPVYLGRDLTIPSK
jgi:hypothetical protein